MPLKWPISADPTLSVIVRNFHGPSKIYFPNPILDLFHHFCLKSGGKCWGRQIDVWLLSNLGNFGTFWYINRVCFRVQTWQKEKEKNVECRKYLSRIVNKSHIPIWVLVIKNVLRNNNVRITIIFPIYFGNIMFHLSIL